MIQPLVSEGSVLSSVMRLLLATLLSGAGLSAAFAERTEPVVGLRDNTPAVHAFTGAAIIVSPGVTIENATLVIRDGVIEAVGPDAVPPPDARVWNLDGKYVYPGFIDAYSNVGQQNPRENLDRGTIAWNPQNRAPIDAAAEYNPEGDGSDQLRSQGFAAALSVPTLGIFRGHVATVSLSDVSVRERVLGRDIAQGLSLTRSREFSGYPTSAMGGIAFIRQSLYDADWHERAHAAYRASPNGLKRPEENAALAALTPAARGDRPFLLEAQNEEEIVRGLRLAEEFPIDLWFRGSGHEYRILDVLSRIDTPLIVPVNFPDAPGVETPEEALSRSLEDLRHWHLAPENPSRLAGAGIAFSLTAHGLDRARDFLPNVRKAVARGLSPETALAALTVRPAALLGLDGTHGTIEPGKTANLIVADDELFESEGTILDVWVDGKRFRVNDPPAVDPRGEWELYAAATEARATLRIAGRPDRLTGRIIVGDREVRMERPRYRAEARRLRVSFSGETLNLPGTIRLSATVSNREMFGWAEFPDGQRIQWAGERAARHDHDEAEEEEPEETETDETEEEAEEPVEDEAKDDEKPDEPVRLALADIRPAMEFGRHGLPQMPEHVIVRSATIWTMGPNGILEEADLLVTRGKVDRVGRRLRAPSGAVEIDAEGRHITPGLIDAHLHSGVFGGINEVGNAIVPEVRIGDLLRIDNIWMYRQIAGGLTTAHVMHGSSNPIGGQNQTIKMRWGMLADDLKFEGAPRTVKFALGENVKRRSSRYPDTRMGTEQIIADHFKAARDYRARWQKWNENGSGIPPRRDLRLDALVDMIDGDILIQCHSYRQDEILMLLRLSEELDFRIKAFHHGVEAYKVAPELAEYGAGAVVWSDWSSFKIESYDATTRNARLLHEAGVVTSLHSDNSQIAGRMNWEAAKMVRAGMDEETALALVTINTARLLGIDGRVGSLEPGKDADFVIWNGHPLSTFTRADQTWIDGAKYFDIDEDREARRRVEQERASLIQLILKND